MVELYLFWMILILNINSQLNQRFI
jgi:hypothetical protein